VPLQISHISMLAVGEPAVQPSGRLVDIEVGHADMCKSEFGAPLPDLRDGRVPVACVAIDIVILGHW
jgi:hypothetical protein